MVCKCLYTSYADDASDLHQYGSICGPLHRLPALSAASAGRRHRTEIDTVCKLTLIPSNRRRETYRNRAYH
eukprot:6184642-Pleurochrysis_carterae.AAC.2